MLITQSSGCKVGWNYWSTREEAEADSVKQCSEAVRKANLGYDFGYQSPGQIDEVVLKQDLRKYGRQHSQVDDEDYPVVAKAGETVYIVTTP